MQTTVLRSYLALAMLMIVLAGCSTAGTSTVSRHASTRPSSTPTQAAANAPAWPGTVCGVVSDALDSNTRQQVTVLTGQVSCSQALRIATTYYHEPPSALQGSAGYATIGLWTCSLWPGAVYASTGHAGYCQDKSGAAAISFDRPGVKAAPIPTTWP
jgi:hypothetical protein